MVDFAAPKIEAALPDVKLPGVELPKVELPVVDFAAPKIEAALPDVKLPGVELPKVELPKVDLAAPKIEAATPEVKLPGVELPKVELPVVDLAAPKIEFGLPDVKLPGVEKPKVGLPKVDLPEVKVEGPDLSGKIGGLAAGLGAGIAGLSAKLDAEMPEAHIELPEVDAKLTSVDIDRLGARIETPAIGIEPLKAEVDWPEVATKVSGATAALPDVSMQMPTASIGAELPAAKIELPEAAIEATLPAAPEVVVDDLGAIKGIGPKYAAQLSAAGITSFAALAAADPQRLRAIINAPGWRQVDYPAWVAEAKVLAAAPRRAAAGDDLMRLEGIGPVYNAKLTGAGISTFAQLAESDEARLAEIIQAPAWRRVRYGEWIEQAQLAAAGDEAGLKALQEQLFSRQGDNLDLIDGLGEKTVAALNAAGIGSYASLAEATPERLAEITRTAGVRGGDFGAWIEEAQLRAAGKRVRRASRSTTLVRKVSCPQDLIKGERHRQLVRNEALCRRHRHLLGAFRGRRRRR